MANFAVKMANPCLAAVAGRLADGAAAGLLAGVARFKKRSITIKV